jgi:hypothetical protein
MLKLGREQNLALEAVDVHAAADLRRNDFHHHFTVERRLLGNEDVRHAAAAELPLEGIGLA